MSLSYQPVFVYEQKTKDGTLYTTIPDLWHGLRTLIGVGDKFQYTNDTAMFVGEVTNVYHFINRDTGEATRVILITDYQILFEEYDEKIRQTNYQDMINIEEAVRTGVMLVGN